mgnify:CR=1 FL=1
MHQSFTLNCSVSFSIKFSIHDAIHSTVSRKLNYFGKKECYFPILEYQSETIEDEISEWTVIQTLPYDDIYIVLLESTSSIQYDRV